MKKKPDKVLLQPSLSYFNHWLIKKQLFSFFILFAHSFLSSNLFSPCLAYGSHKLACLCDVGRHCVEGRERKGVNVYSTYPWHPATTLLLLKEGRWWWKVSVSIGRLVELLFKQQKERNRKRKKEKQQSYFLLWFYWNLNVVN